MLALSSLGFTMARPVRVAASNDRRGKFRVLAPWAAEQKKSRMSSNRPVRASQGENAFLWLRHTAFPSLRFPQRSYNYSRIFSELHQICSDPVPRRLRPTFSTFCDNAGRRGPPLGELP